MVGGVSDYKSLKVVCIGRCVASIFQGIVQVLCKSLSNRKASIGHKGIVIAGVRYYLFHIASWSCTQRY